MSAEEFRLLIPSPSGSAAPSSRATATSRSPARMWSAVAGRPRLLEDRRTQRRHRDAAGRLGPAVVTSEYPIYCPDPDAGRSSFLALLLRTEPFRSCCSAPRVGRAGERDHPTQFETLEVPLPEPGTSSAGGGPRHGDGGSSGAADARRTAPSPRRNRVRSRARPDAPAGPAAVRSRIARFAEMDRWSHEGALHTARAGEYQLESDHEIVSLEDVAEVSYGISKTPSNRPGTSARPYLRVANVQMNSLDLRKIKYIDVPDSEMERYRLLNKDILICEGNSIDLVGRGCMWHDEIPDCVHQNHIIKVRSVDQEEADPDFVLACINSSLGQAYFRSKAKRTTNLASINSTEVKEFSFPLPQDVAVQAELAGHLNLGLNEAEQARASAQSTRAQADAAFAEAVFG